MLHNDIEEIVLIMDDLQERMDKSIDAYKSELNLMRAGRANMHILDGVTVEYYGVDTPLNQVANISIPEARIIMITVWDSSILKKVEKAIIDANLGITPNNDGKNIRLIFPEPTQERRNALVKEVKNNGEKCKIAIRNIRRDAVAGIKGLEKSKTISEDVEKDCEDEIEKKVSGKIAEVDKIASAKETEIMTV